MWWSSVEIVAIWDAELAIEWSLKNPLTTTAITCSSRWGSGDFNGLYQNRGICFRTPGDGSGADFLHISHTPKASSNEPKEVTGI